MKCITPDCKKKAMQHGLCYSHLLQAYTYKRQHGLTWYEMFVQGRASKVYLSESMKMKYTTDYVPGTVSPEDF
jgi:hypothetical protein